MAVEAIVQFRLEFCGMTDEKIIDFVVNDLDTYFQRQKMICFFQQGLNFTEGFIDFSQTKLEKVEVISIFENKIMSINNTIEIKNCG